MERKQPKLVQCSPDRVHRCRLCCGTYPSSWASCRPFHLGVHSVSNFLHCGLLEVHSTGGCTVGSRVCDICTCQDSVGSASLRAGSERCLAIFVDIRASSFTALYDNQCQHKVRHGMSALHQRQGALDEWGAKFSAEWRRRANTRVTDSSFRLKRRETHVLKGCSITLGISVSGS